MVLDAGYKTPAIASFDRDQIEPFVSIQMSTKQEKASSENMSMYTTNTMIIYMSGRKNPKVFYHKSRWLQRI